MCVKVKADSRLEGNSQLTVFEFVFRNQNTSYLSELEEVLQWEPQ